MGFKCENPTIQSWYDAGFNSRMFFDRPITYLRDLDMGYMFDDDDDANHWFELGYIDADQEIHWTETEGV